MVKMLCEDKCISLDMCNENQSMIIVGKTRSGKTYFGLQYARKLATSGYAVHLIDLGDKWSVQDKNSLKNFRRVPERQVLRIFFPSRIDLLNSMHFLAEALGHTSIETNCALRNAVSHTFLDPCQNVSFEQILNKLRENGEDDNGSRIVADKFASFGEVPHIEFIIDAEQSTKMARTCMMWDLSVFENGYVSCIAQLVLSALFSINKMAFREGKGEKRMYILIDEFQCLKWSQNSILGKYLTEGAKYRCYLILMTQYLVHRFSEGVFNQLQQVGFHAYFCLTSEDAAYVSKQLTSDIETQKELRALLCGLPQGKFLLKGPHYVGGSTTISEDIRLIHVDVDRDMPKKCVIIPQNYKKNATINRRNSGHNGGEQHERNNEQRD